MPGQVVSLLSAKRAKDYIVLNDSEFRKQVRSRMVALVAAAFDYWVTLAKSTFSRSTEKRYLESIYWDSRGASSLVFGVIPNSLADILEYGQDAFVMDPHKWLKGRTHVKVPIDLFFDKENPRGTKIGGDRPGRYVTESTRSAFNVSKDSLLGILDDTPPDVAHDSIVTNFLGTFRRVNAKRGLKASPKMQYSGTGAGVRVMTPASTWKHPGVRAALLINLVVEFIESNREPFVESMFSSSGRTEVDLT